MGNTSSHELTYLERREIYEAIDSAGLTGKVQIIEYDDQEAEMWRIEVTRLAHEFADEQIAAKNAEIEKLQARVRELEGLIKSAYIEGYLDTFEVVKEGTRKYAEEYWKHSESCKQLKGPHDER